MRGAAGGRNRGARGGGCAGRGAPQRLPYRGRRRGDGGPTQPLGCASGRRPPGNRGRAGSPATRGGAARAHARADAVRAPRPGIEELLTLRWGVWLGGAALLLAGVFLVRTAVEEGWLGPAARCALAGLLGLALVAAAEWLRRTPQTERPGIPWPDQAPPALAAGGVAVLFGAAYATASLYALAPPLAGFARWRSPRWPGSRWPC